MDKKIISLAVELHGHLAPGIALGLRMSEIALLRLNVERGNKHLIGISETARCLADAMQAATGCTLGHGNAFVEDYGKLAITIGDTRNNKGVRVGLKDEAMLISPLMDKWMMRKGKLTKDEEKILGESLLYIDEKYFDVKDVSIKHKQKFESSKIIKCGKCSALIPQSLSISQDDKEYCKACI